LTACVKDCSECDCAKEGAGRKQSRQQQSKAAIRRGQLVRIPSVSTSNSWWLECHFFELTAFARDTFRADTFRILPIRKAAVPPVFALNQPLLPSVEPSKKMFQTALRNPFFRMRRDNSIRKNSCQAKNALLQSNQYARAERIGEALKVLIMLPFRTRNECGNSMASYTAGLLRRLRKRPPQTRRVSSRGDLWVPAFLVHWEC
jgi:hypothetical protein